MASLERRVAEIEKRNARVELDKEWEISFTRRALIALFTYLSIGVYFAFIGIANPWLNAAVPTAAFLLSTLTLPFFRRIWEKKKGN